MCLLCMSNSVNGDGGMIHTLAVICLSVCVCVSLFFLSFSMESVSDHDYLNFDPKTNCVWNDNADTSFSVLRMTENSGSVSSPQSDRPVGKGDNEEDLSDMDYENMKDLIMDFGGDAQSISEFPPRKSGPLENASEVPLDRNSGNNSRKSATAATGSSCGEGANAGTKETTQIVTSGEELSVQSLVKMKSSRLPSQSGQDSSIPKPVPKVSPRPSPKPSLKTRRTRLLSSLHSSFPVPNLQIKQLLQNHLLQSHPPLLLLLLRLLPQKAPPNSLAIPPK